MPPSSDYDTQGSFVTTRWTLVLAVGEAPTAAADAALETLCRAYWPPLYCFARRQGCSTEEAEDVIQAFFERLLRRNDLARVTPHKGRFRSYLLAALKHFLVNEWRRARTQKRGGGQAFIPMESFLAEERTTMRGPLSPDASFERRWALTLLETVLGRLQTEFAGDPRVFESWNRTLNENPVPDLTTLAAELDTNENALRQAFHRLRGRYRQLLREEVAQTVTQPGEIEDELRHLAHVLRS